MATPSSRLASGLRAQPHLLRLLLGQAFSGFGSRLHDVALMWIAVQQVGGEAGFVAAAGTAARLVFGPLGGVYADRWDRRHTLVAADLLRAAVVTSLPLAAAVGPLQLWHLALVAGCVGALDSLFNPALQASLPALTPDQPTLQRTNALLDLTTRLPIALGPSLTGVLLALMPITHFFTIDALSFVASAGAILSLGRGYAWKPRAALAARGARGIVGDIAGAVRLVREHRALGWGLLSLLVSAVAWGTASLVGIPLFADRVLGGDAATYGYIMGAYGAANVAANLIMARMSIRRRVPVCFGGAVLFGLGFVALSTAPNLGVAMSCAALASLGGPMMDLMLLVMIQTDFPPDQIGKVYSLRATASSVGSSLGLLMAAPLFALLPVGVAIAGVGATAALFAVGAWLRVSRAPASGR